MRGLDVKAQGRAARLAVVEELGRDRGAAVADERALDFDREQHEDAGRFHGLEHGPAWRAADAGLGCGCGE
jgi:hypothetical protein